MFWLKQSSSTCNGYKKLIRLNDIKDPDVACDTGVSLMRHGRVPQHTGMPVMAHGRVTWTYHTGVPLRSHGRVNWTRFVIKFGIDIISCLMGLNN